jgi:opacity protein-like surface antigen
LISKFGFRLLATFASTTILASLAFIGGPSAPAQTGPKMKSTQSIWANTDVSLGTFGQLTPTRISTRTSNFQLAGMELQTVEQKTQGTSLSAGVLGTFHQSFRPWLGYNVNLGYSRFGENYSDGFVSNPPLTGASPNSSFYHASIGTNMYELTGAYVVEGPKAKRLSTFGQLGGGALFFLPTKDPSPTSMQIRPAMVFGGGINYKFSSHLALRAEYRGEFYKNPDFKQQELKFTVTNAPTVSIVYAFGSRGHSAKRP